MMLHLGLIGYPLEHSLSPPIHLGGLLALGLDADYQLYAIPPQAPEQLRALIERVRGREIHGLNVTIPHKQNVIPFLDDLTPAAQAMGAVNTILCEGQGLRGDNTDAPGFWLDLGAHFPHLIETGGGGGKPRQALLLGAGGSARAVLYALASHGWAVCVAARRIQQAQSLIDSFHSQDILGELAAIPLSAPDIQPWLPELDLIINATPLGMYPHPDATPWPLGLDLPQRAVFYDLVYNPPQTLFVRQARAAGLSAASGLGMLVEQAALSDERWTGKSPPRAPMFAAVPHHLRGIDV